jgi:hypothetical protein
MYGEFNIEETKPTRSYGTVSFIPCVPSLQKDIFYARRLRPRSQYVLSCRLSRNYPNFIIPSLISGGPKAGVILHAGR